MNSRAQSIGMDNDVAQGFENMICDRPVAPVMILSSIEGIMVTSSFTTKQAKYEVDLAAWKKGQKLHDYKKNMDAFNTSCTFFKWAF